MELEKPRLPLPASTHGGRVLGAVLHSTHNGVKLTVACYISLFPTALLDFFPFSVSGIITCRGEPLPCVLLSAAVCSLLVQEKSLDFRTRSN